MISKPIWIAAYTSPKSGNRGFLGYFETKPSEEDVSAYLNKFVKVNNKVTWEILEFTLLELSPALEVLKDFPNLGFA